MVDRIGSGGSLAREAILAALKSQAKAAEHVQQAAARLETKGTEKSTAVGGSGFLEKIGEQLHATNAEVQKAEELPEDFVKGSVQDFHEVAIRLKTAEVSFRFAMEVRNKLIDAYREVMRMNV